MKFENNDLIIFENGATGTFVESDSGNYIKFSSGVEEGYKKDYHNSIIIAYIRDSIYHALSDKTRRQLICDGIMVNLEYMSEYIYDTELLEKISQIRADVLKIQAL